MSGRGTWKEGSKELLLAAELVSKTKYPAIRKACIYLNAANHIANDSPTDADAMKVATGFLDSTMALLPEIFADKELPANEAAGLINLFGRLSISMTGDRKALAAKAIEVMEKSPLDRSIVLTARGGANIDYAWDARGNGMANVVKPDGWRLFKDRLALARKQLEEAWKLDNTNDEAAILMIHVETGDSNGRAEMEKWFSRAMKADPRSLFACRSKMTWLEPKWYGSAEDLVAFGRECRKTGLDQKNSMLPMILVDAHWLAAAYGKRQDGRANREYFEKNDAAWKDVSSVYEWYFKTVGKETSRYHRTRYAVLAEWSGHYKEADAVFTELGDEASAAVLYSTDLVRAVANEAADAVEASYVEDPRIKTADRAPAWNFAVKTFCFEGPLLAHNEVPDEFKVEIAKSAGAITGAKKSDALNIGGVLRGHFGKAITWDVPRGKPMNVALQIVPKFDDRHFVLIYDTDHGYDPADGGRYHGTILAQAELRIKAGTPGVIYVRTDPKTGEVNIQSKGRSLLKKPFHPDGDRPLLFVFAVTARDPGERIETTFKLTEIEEAK